MRNGQRLVFLQENTNFSYHSEPNFTPLTFNKLGDHDGTLTVVLLFVLQILLSLSAIAFYAIGLLYIDNNTTSRKSIPLIAAALASKILGMQLGLWPNMGDLWWLIWLILSILNVINGIVIGLFPKQLKQTKSNTSEQQSILNTNYPFTFLYNTTFCSTMRRLFANKLLWCLLLSASFVCATYLNFALEENNYVQSRFFMSYNIRDGLQQEWQQRFYSIFLEYPSFAISMLIASGFIIKMKLSARYV